MENHEKNRQHAHTDIDNDALFALRDIRPTSVRVLVLNELERAECAKYARLIYRCQTSLKVAERKGTLNLFLSHHMVHCIEDGTGMTKYALCEPDCHCGEKHEGASLTDLHTHFRCERCGRTFCLRGLPVPSVPLPPGFKLTSANYVLVGLCPECSHIL